MPVRDCFLFLFLPRSLDLKPSVDMWRVWVCLSLASLKMHPNNFVTWKATLAIFLYTSSWWNFQACGSSVITCLTCDWMGIIQISFSLLFFLLFFFFVLACVTYFIWNMENFLDCIYFIDVCWWPVPLALVSMLVFCIVEKQSTCMKQLFGFWCPPSDSAWILDAHLHCRHGKQISATFFWFCVSWFIFVGCWKA